MTCPVPLLQHAAEFTALLDIYRALQPVRILEIGSFFGGSLWHWLTVGSAPELVVSVDLPVGPDDERYGEARRCRALWPGWVRPETKLVRVNGSSRDAAVTARVSDLGPFDFVFVDGGHEYETVVSDFYTYAPFLRPGGVIALHDTALLPAVRRAWEEVRFGRDAVEIVAAGGCGIGVVRAQPARPVHVYTRAFRYELLPAVAASVEAGLAGLDYHWWVSFDPNQGIPELPPRAIPVPTIGPLPYGLDGLQAVLARIESGWVYGLDDDNAIHPRLRDALALAGTRGVIMPQSLAGGRVRELKSVPRVCEVDLAQFVLDRGAIGNWRPADAQADGRLIENVYSGGGVARVPFPASYYNYLVAYPAPRWWELT